MTLVGASEQLAALEKSLAGFPSEVEFVISAIEAGPQLFDEKRKIPRYPYRVKAMLKLFSDGPDNPPWELYTRRVNAKAIDFLAPRPLPLSHGGILTLPTPGGRTLQIGCTVLRCRQAAPDWFDGAVYFNREQSAFSSEFMEE